MTETNKPVHPDIINVATPAPPAVTPPSMGSPDLLETIFVAIFIPIAALSWVGILLAELGGFSGSRVFAGGMLLSVLPWIAAIKDYRASGTSTVKSAWVSLTFVIVVAAGLFSRPGEYLIEGADASVYLATGRHIASSGEIVSTDPAMAVVPLDLRQIFFPRDRIGASLENRLPGGMRIGKDDRITPSFFHLLPVWVAIASALGGTWAGYFVSPVFAVLGVGVAWLIGRRVWCPLAGLVAAALLATNFAQIHFSRVPSSEMLAQFMILSGVYFTALTWDCRTRVIGACAGVAVGLAAFTRVDALLVMVPLAVLWLGSSRRRIALRRAWWWYVIALAVVGGHAILHAGLFGADYVQRLVVLPQAVGVVPRQIAGVLAVVAALVIGTAVFALRRVRGRWLVWAGLSAALLLAFLSPVTVKVSILLLSPIGAAGALAGLALLLSRHVDERSLPVVAPLIAEAFLLLAWIDTPVLPDGFRRFVPLVLPLAMLVVGFLVTHVRRRSGKAALGIWLLPVVLGSMSLVEAAPILRTPPMRGVHGQIAEIAKPIPPEALVITDESVPGHLGLALQYTFGRASLRMNTRPASGAGIGPLLARATSDGRAVFVASAPLAESRANGLWRSDFAGFDIRQEASATLRYTLIAPAVVEFPRALRTDNVPVVLYRVVAFNRDATTPVPLTIDVGDNDFQALIGGFHAPETFQSVRARWTKGLARIAIPRIGIPESGRAVIVLRLSATRPQEMAPAAVRVSIDGLLAGVINEVSADFREYRLTLPADVVARIKAAPTILELATATFVPKVAGGSSDDRKLGIVLDWIRIQ